MRSDALPAELVQQLSRSLVEAESRNAEPHGAELAFAKKVQGNPNVLNLRYGRIRRVVRMLGAVDGVLLDAGAGKCLNAVMAVIAGVRQVYAIEMEPNRHRAAELFLDSVASLGIAGHIKLTQGDILDVNLPEEHFDAAWSWELLEHIANPSQFQSKLFLWLRPGGRVYHRTGANGANPIKIRMSYSRYWDEVDRLVLAPIRREIISELADRYLSQEDLEKLISNTRGLVKDEISIVLELWQKNGELPDTLFLHENVQTEAVSIQIEHFYANRGGFYSKICG